MNDVPLIKMEALAKVFLTDEIETHALADINLEVRRGEYLSIEGPSGCGKSTLLSILGLLDTPNGGTSLLQARTVNEVVKAQTNKVRMAVPPSRQGIPPSFSEVHLQK